MTTNQYQEIRDTLSALQAQLYAMELQDCRARDNGDSKPLPGMSLRHFVRLQERRLIQSTLNRHGGSREKAALSLGISVATLYRKMA
jgi:transcriptional regulator with PAS, ATPase and Fis domain